MLDTVRQAAEAAAAAKQAERAVERAGAGIALPKKAGAEQIRAAVQRVLAIPSYRRAAAQLGTDIRERDGAEVAADAISAHFATV